jgi:hypothetical protein
MDPLRVCNVVKYSIDNKMVVIVYPTVCRPGPIGGCKAAEYLLKYNTDNKMVVLVYMYSYVYDNGMIIVQITRWLC